MKNQINWTLKKIKVSSLKEWQGNPRRLTEKGMKDLRASITKFGLAEPLCINTDYTICGGHGRKRILEELGIKEVDCYMPEKKLTENQFKELNIRLNKNTAGEFNFDILANEFAVPELLDYGFTENELGIGAEELPEKLNSEEIRPFIRTHILISFPPDKLLQIQDYLNAIKKIEGIEIEQGSN